MSYSDRLNMKIEEDALKLGFKSTQEALDNGYEVVCEELVRSVEYEMRDEKEKLLNGLDYVIEYLKSISVDNEDELADVINNVRNAEKYINERY